MYDLGMLPDYRFCRHGTGINMFYCRFFGMKCEWNTNKHVTLPVCWFLSAWNTNKHVLLPVCWLFLGWNTNKHVLLPVCWFLSAWNRNKHVLLPVYRFCRRETQINTFCCRFVGFRWDGTQINMF